MKDKTYSQAEVDELIAEIQTEAKRRLHELSEHHTRTLNTIGEDLRGLLTELRRIK